MNTTLWLEAVVGGKNISATKSNFILTLGGNVSNPKCTTDTGGESMKTLFDRLSQCNETILRGCNNEALSLEYDQSVFDTCNTTTKEIRDKVDECDGIEEG